MPGLVLNGMVYPTKFPCRNFLDDPNIKLLVGKGLDGIDLGNNRGPDDDVRQIIIHTTKGEVARVIRPGSGPVANDGEKVARFWSTADNRGGGAHQSGAHIVIDRDGDVHVLADLGRVCAHHASNSAVNRNSIGIEVYQEGEKEDFALYEIQLIRLVQLVDLLTRLFGIQRQIPHGYFNRPIARLVVGGKDCVGVFGHRDVTSNRSQGDPGDQLMRALARPPEGGHPYEQYNFGLDEDKKIWVVRQRELNIPATGIPYTATAAALIKAGRKHGQWVPRPGD